MIHVSVIVGSYGPFTLGMILGIVSLILMVFLTKNNGGVLINPTTGDTRFELTKIDPVLYNQIQRLKAYK